jgi:hypothetical protein
VLGQLAKLAERLHLAVVMIAHLNKAPAADPYQCVAEIPCAGISAERTISGVMSSRRAGT